MPNPNTPPEGARPIQDAARLSRSFSEIFGLLDKAAPSSGAFCPGHAVGIVKPQANYSLWIKDVSPSEVVVGCWGCDHLWQAPYTIASDGTVTFGKAAQVAERFVPVEGEELTDAVAVADEEFELLDAVAADRGPRLRLLSTKANTVINGRVYPMTLLREAITKLRDKLKTGAVYSEVPHPKPIKREGKVVGFESNPERRVSRLLNVEMNDKGEVWVEHEFLKTPIATEVYASFQNRTRKYGTSTRAIGLLDERTLSGRQIPIAKTMHLHTWDFVPNPALAETISQFEVLLDSELSDSPHNPPTQEAPGAISPAGESLTDAAPTAPKQEEIIPMAGSNAQNTHIVPAPAATPAPTPAALSADDRALLDQAKAIIDADAQRRTAEQAKAQVSEFVQSENAKSAIAGLPEAMHQPILDRVAKAATKDEAERVLTDEVELASRITAAAKLAAQGFGQAPAGVGSTTSEPGRQVDIQVTSNPTPHLEVAKKFGEAYDDYARMVSGSVPDDGLRKQNKAFVDKLVAGVETKAGKALLDSAGAILDSSASFDVFADSTTTANLLNQPSITTAFLIQQFQDLTMLQACGGIGPEGFEQQGFNGKIGSVLKVPVEVYVPPIGSLDLPGWDNGLSVAEDAGIPTASIRTVWLTYAPIWRRIAAELTKDAAKALQNGPLNYNALARLVYHLIEDKKRRINSAIAEEMLLTADEYQAVRKDNEAVDAANVIANSGAGQLYGATVAYYANLIGSGTVAVPNRNPIVRPRVVPSMDNAGQVTTSTINQASVSAPAAQVQGYLDGNGNIQSFPGGGTATYAVDYVNGRIVFTAASTVNNTTVLPTVSYTYATNYDVFSLTVPNGVEPSTYYNRLLERVDATAALMGSSPRFMAPNLVMGSLNAMTKVTNAEIFWKIASPEGSRLLQSNNHVAVRNGREFMQHNIPWSVGDSRLLLTRMGACKYGVDTPFEIEGPYPTYDNSVSPARIRDTKVVYGAENSVIATPQVTDNTGKVLNPVSRSIIFR